MSLLQNTVCFIGLFRNRDKGLAHTHTRKEKKKEKKSGKPDIHESTKKVRLYSTNLKVYYVIDTWRI